MTRSVSGVKLVVVGEGQPVIFCHSRNSSRRVAVAPWSVSFKLIHRLAGHRLKVVVPDLGPDNWGDDEAMRRLSIVADWLGPPVALVGQSMGNVTALAWAAANRGAVTAVVGVLPAAYRVELVNVPYRAYYVRDDPLIAEADVLTMVAFMGPNAAAIRLRPGLGHSRRAVNSVPAAEVALFLSGGFSS